MIGLREHANPSFSGLRLIRGNKPDYPLIESYYVHGIGAGVRQRGGAAVMQVDGPGLHGSVLLRHRAGRGFGRDLARPGYTSRTRPDQE